MKSPLDLLSVGGFIMRRWMMRRTLQRARRRTRVKVRVLVGKERNQTAQDEQEGKHDDDEDAVDDDQVI